jgi:hypothetical protein
MQANSRCTDDPLMAQRAIVRQVLRTDHRETGSRQQRQRTLSGVTPKAIIEAVVLLHANGVISGLDEPSGTSPPARPLDSLRESMAVADAVFQLHANGVMLRLDEFVGASRCARHLDALGLIAG